MSRPLFPQSVLFLSIALLALPALATSPEGYYRFPAIHGDSIVFTAEGDLWTVSTSGGTARRLTTHHGEETRAAISPDGLTLAFTGAYEGPLEVYTMPLAGGQPKRCTWESDPSIVVGWKPGGELLYTTVHYSTLPDLRLVELDLGADSRHLVPLHQASEAAWDAEGETLFFVRPAYHYNNTKRYRGGTARDIWRFNGVGEEAANLTGDFPGGDHSPMFWQARVYFVTDRDGTMNVWSMGTEGEDPRQETRHSGWDVKSPDLHDGRIVYQLGADLWLLDLSSGETVKVPITLASDFDQLREKWVKDPLEYLTAYDPHPDGKSLVLTTRGRVFVFPAKEGRQVRLERKAGVRYRDAVFMPAGDEILLLSDETGELEFRLLPADGASSGRALSDDGKVLRFDGMPSPDGNWIAYRDHDQNLFILGLHTGEQRRINDLQEGIGRMNWSPDSRWLAYERWALNAYRQILLYNVEEGSTTELTSDRVNSLSPAWSPDGEWLYFLSDRELDSLVRSPWGQRQPEPFFDHSMQLFHVALREGLRSPFRTADELAAGEDEGNSEEMGKKKEEPAGEAEAPVEVKVDLEGLARRLWQVPVPAGNYSVLSATDDALFWLAEDSGPDAATHLMALEIGNEGKEPVRVVADVDSYRMAGKKAKLALRKEDAFYIIKAGAQEVEDLEDVRVDLSGWSFPIAMREDFRQLFIDAWRLERDYFYDPGMHGVDWGAVRDKYLPLVDRITTRKELSDLIGEVVGELSALHVSVRGGDLREGDDQVVVATLGARLERDAEAGGYRIDYIYKSDPDFPQWRSPLADPFLEVNEGDVIEAINGVPILSVADPSELLRNQEDRQVRLRLRRAGGEERDIIAVPTSSERTLRYRDWEYTRRLATDEMSTGEIGYVHLRAMTGNDLSEWYRSFYPVFKRKGLILDMRHNRGGNIDSLILEKLMRRAWFYWKGRVGEPTWNQQYAFRGHMVVLVDQNTASDGEAFAEGFRRLGLGKVIGTRTWGGEIWLSSNNRLTDLGYARAPQSGVYGPEGEWLIEGHGVDPDIVVDNLPHETFNGRDAQLEAAVAHLQELIAADPRDVPPPPAYPDKSFVYP